MTDLKFEITNSESKNLLMVKTKRNLNFCNLFLLNLNTKVPGYPACIL